MARTGTIHVGGTNHSVVVFGSGGRMFGVGVGLFDEGRRWFFAGWWLCRVLTAGGAWPF